MQTAVLVRWVPGDYDLFDNLRDLSEHLKRHEMVLIHTRLGHGKIETPEGTLLALVEEKVIRHA